MVRNISLIMRHYVVFYSHPACRMTAYYVIIRLVKLILNIARYLNLCSVAEDVETDGLMKLLQNAGCDLVQGFHFSRPLPPAEFERLILHKLSPERK